VEAGLSSRVVLEPCGDHSGLACSGTSASPAPRLQAEKSDTSTWRDLVKAAGSPGAAANHASCSSSSSPAATANHHRRPRLGYDYSQLQGLLGQGRLEESDFGEARAQEAVAHDDGSRSISRLVQVAQLRHDAFAAARSRHLSLAAVSAAALAASAAKRDADGSKSIEECMAIADATAVAWEAAEAESRHQQVKDMEASPSQGSCASLLHTPPHSVCQKAASSSSANLNLESPSPNSRPQNVQQQSSAEGGALPASKPTSPGPGAGPEPEAAVSATLTTSHGADTEAEANDLLWAEFLRRRRASRSSSKLVVTSPGGAMRGRGSVELILETVRSLREGGGTAAGAENQLQRALVAA